jgi:hypothetical protein
MNKVAPADNKAFTTQQVADRWSCHHQSVRKWQRAGLLDCILLGRQRRYLLSDILKAEEKMAALGALKKPAAGQKPVAALKAKAAVRQRSAAPLKAKAIPKQKATANLRYETVTD